MMNNAFDPRWEPEENFEEQADLGDSLSRLSASPDEEAMQTRLNLVDHLLRNAPLVKPSAEFAERVLEVLRRNNRPFNASTGIGLAIGFSAVVLFSLTTLLIIIGIFALVLLNWTSLYQNFVLAIGSLGQTLRQALESPQASSPLMVGLSLMAVPLAGVWLWVMRQLTPSGTSD